MKCKTSIVAYTVSKLDEFIRPNKLPQTYDLYLGNAWFEWALAVTYLFEAQCYKLEGEGFDFRLRHWIFQLT
jgi:hypothetical protein